MSLPDPAIVRTRRELVRVVADMLCEVADQFDSGVRARCAAASGAGGRGGN